jgi:hypothetical protein
MLGIDCSEEPLSTRVAGVAADMFLKKRKLLQAVPLKVDHIKILEIAAVSCFPLEERAIAGHLLFALYSSARWADSQRVDTLELSRGSFGRSLINAGLAKSKTSISLDQKTRLLPLMALTDGLVPGVSWGSHWMQLREEMGLSPNGESLTPALSADGRWLMRKLTSGEAGQHLKDILVAGGASLDDVEQYSSHSLKVTCLSWLAKYGCDFQLRQLMGHHLHSTLKSVVTYSRDALVQGHAVLSDIIEEIRAGIFNPDVSTADLVQQRTKKARRELDSSFVEPSVDTVFDDVYTACSIDPVISDASDVDDDRLQSALTEAWEIWQDSNPNAHPIVDLPFDHLDLFQHSLHGTLHIRRADHSLRCGRYLSPNYAPAVVGDTVRWPVCLQCKLSFTSSVSMSD